MNDEEIQERLQRGEAVNTPEGAAFRKVFSALSREPRFSLPPSFADRVLSRAVASSGSADMFWLFAGLTACLIALAVAISLSGFTLKLKVPGFISAYPGLIFFGILVVFALHLVDRRLLRKTA